MANRQTQIISEKNSQTSARIVLPPGEQKGLSFMSCQLPKDACFVHCSKESSMIQSPRKTPDRHQNQTILFFGHTQPLQKMSSTSLLSYLGHTQAVIIFSLRIMF